MIKWILLFLLPVFIFGQEASRWGMAFDVGTMFKTSDSLALKYAVTEVDTSDVVYTDAQEMQQNTEGIFKVVFYVDSIDAISDSINVDLRLGYKFTSSVVKWDSWNNIFANKTVATLYDTVITTTNCSWWGPSNIRQYRIYRSDTAKDTLSTPYLTDYLR